MRPEKEGIRFEQAANKKTGQRQPISFLIAESSILNGPRYFITFILPIWAIDLSIKPAQDSSGAKARVERNYDAGR